MDWSDDNRERLEVALTEADVVGVRLSVNEGGAVDVLLHVLALPESGPMENDPRRILRFCGVADVSVLLRRVTRDGNGPPIELAGLDAVEEFFESLVTGDSLYGWRYFDEPSLTEDWPEQPSLRLTLDANPAPHQFYWFNECGRHEQGELRSYCIEGTIGFRDLEVLDAEGHPQNSMSSSPTALGGGGACRSPTHAYPSMPRATRASAKSSGGTGRTSRGRRSRQTTPESPARAHYPDSRGRLRDAYQASGRIFHIERTGKSAQSWR